MGHSNVWNSHPKNYGPGSRTCRVNKNSSSPVVNLDEELSYLATNAALLHHCGEGIGIVILNPID
ncbi:unnamed protein product [Lupinus luteus]|uniref:Uncharacterized protein n=1 Tax=Lupinus luteus TaxID=3873 RepID=A0AAV1XDZ1_LUPLU